MYKVLITKDYILFELFEPYEGLCDSAVVCPQPGPGATAPRPDRTALRELR